ncbi:serpin B5 [Manduca sexta]|uniref:serpin B5 n=2 Tax=Manduca sexta TaxID=7130 RepID=UPI00188F1D44|nr:serpin B5 [Manduca sexta]
MKVFVLLFALLSATVQEDVDSVVICGVGDDNIEGFREALYDFNMKLYKKLAEHTHGHFVISAPPLWQSLAAIAESMDGVARQELLQLLGLPEDECTRQTYYQLASSRETFGLDVTMQRKHVFFIDEGLNMNTEWVNLASTQFNLHTIPVPIKRAPKDVAYLIRHIISSQLAPLNLQGNSLLADEIDYNGLWSEAFPEADIIRSPFYDHEGNQIGSVDLMRIKRRVRMVFVEQINARVVEIPVGVDGRYRMLFGIPVEGHDMRKSIEKVTATVMFEMVAGLKESEVPIDVAIPRFVTTTESDVRAVLEQVGLKSLWTDASATRNISQPAVMPSGFVQRAEITLDSHGIDSYNPEFIEFTEYSTGLDPKLGHEMIANRPFMYGLFDAETYVL